MIAIDLLRHGETTAQGRYCGSTDVALSAEGWRQLDQAVAGRRWSRIISSPLRRCRDFAQSLALRLSLDCEIDPRWRELHFGDWENCSATELMENEPEALLRFWQDPENHSPPAGESLMQLRERVLAAWNELLASSDAADVLVVTHGGPIRVLMAQLMSSPPGKLLEIEVKHAVPYSVHATRHQGQMKVALLEGKYA